MMMLFPWWHVRSMKERLPASALGWLLCSFGCICWWAAQTMSQVSALTKLRATGNTSGVPLSSTFFGSMRSTAHKVPRGLCLGMCRKVMNHRLLYILYPGQTAHLPLCHTQGYFRGQETKTRNVPEVLSTQYFKTNECEGCSAPLKHSPLRLRLEHPKSACFSSVFASAE